MKSKTKKLIKKTSAVLFAAACLFSLFLPFPKKLTGAETYECVWSDGSVSIESYTSAYQSLAGMDGESVLLDRQGLTGRIASEVGAIYSALDKGGLAEILNCSYGGTRLDGAALYRTFSKRVWYSGTYFIWTGNQIKRVSSTKKEEIVLLSGSVTSRILKETQASSVDLRAEAAINANTFADSNVTSIKVEAPYSESGGAIYMDTAGGKRLIAALPSIEGLTLDEDLKFADEGALIACQNLQNLTVPFWGSELAPATEDYAGELAHLFSNGREYLVPKSLSRVTVMGGIIGAFAFYACPNLKEIDACKVDPNEIAEQAFLNLDALELLHTPKRNVLLTGQFTSYTAECGCTIFERVHSQK